MGPYVLKHYREEDIVGAISVQVCKLKTPVSRSLAVKASPT